jgi:hypothetical protein
MKEFGENEELLALIIVSQEMPNPAIKSSLEDWDDKMQIECAKAFISPIVNDVRILILPDIDSESPRLTASAYSDCVLTL